MPEQIKHNLADLSVFRATNVVYTTWMRHTVVRCFLSVYVSFYGMRSDIVREVAP